MITVKTQEWELKNIDTILFDKDGTFIDLHFFWGKMTELRCLEIIKFFGLEETLFPKLCFHLGYDLQTKRMLSDGITALYSRSKIIEIFKDNLVQYGIKTSNDIIAKIFDDVSEIFYKNIIEYTHPIEDAICFIKQLRQRNLKLGIVTSDSIISTRLTLKHFGWENIFDVAIGREDSVETKESGALTKLALEKLAANPETTIMIGDAPMDYISAINAGIKRTILVETGQLTIEELKKTSNFTVKTLKEIEILSS